MKATDGLVCSVTAGDPVPAAWNATSRDYDRTATVVDLLDASADRFPGRPALAGCAGVTHTHRELREATTRFAHRLRERGVGPGDAVGVYSERNTAAVAAMIAIMRCGAAYVPLDSRWPEHRVRDVAERVGMRCMAVGQQVQEPPVPVVLSTVDSPADCPDATLGIGPGADDVAYTIFTSGSTGRPKGVRVRHRSVVNMIDFINREFEVGPGDRSLASASFCFDLSVYDIFGVLAAGGCVRVTSDEENGEPGLLAEVMLTEPVTIWNAAPAAMMQLIPFLQIEERSGRDDMRLVLMGGDWIPVTLPGDIRAEFPKARLISFGGATELTVWSTCHEIGEVPPDAVSIPYGKPIQNARCYVLDGQLMPCPVGVAGDLYTAGDLVALDYAAAPELTEARFLPDPWASEQGERMYRTGDRARWQADGSLEFLGRLDDQVKVHGYRIELGEVQAVLNQCPGVRAAVALAPDTPTGRELVAFYTPAGEQCDDELRAFLLDRLPEYMVPSKITAVAEFPAGPTGKIDRAALLA